MSNERAHLKDKTHMHAVSAVSLRILKAFCQPKSCLEDFDFRLRSTGYRGEDFRKFETLKRILFLKTAVMFQCRTDARTDINLNIDWVLLKALHVPDASPRSFSRSAESFFEPKVNIFADSRPLRLAV